MHVSQHVHSTQVDGQAAAQLLAFEWQHVSVTLSKHQVMSDLRAGEPKDNRNKSQSMTFECYFLFMPNIVECHGTEAETLERFLRKNGARALLDDVYERDSTCDLVFALFVPTSLRFFIILSTHTHRRPSKSTQ